ncbi:MAG: TnpV protein [Lachnospiraceae bacterium]
MAKITYTNVNEYLIPNLIYKSNEQIEELGRYGILRKNYLKKHKNSLYQCMLLQGTVEKHLLEIDKAAREREELILKQLEKRYGLPDKKSDYLVWIRAVNQQKAIAEEIILKEPIYI